MMDNRLIIEKRGMTLINLPVLIVIVVALFAPWVAVVSAIGALMSGCSVHIERNPDAHAAPYHYEDKDM